MMLSLLRCYGNESRLPRKLDWLWLALILEGEPELLQMSFYTCLTEAWISANLENLTDMFRDWNGYSWSTFFAAAWFVK